MGVESLNALLKSSPKYSRASAYILSSDITTFIPSCAQSCFLSFLDANFPTSICSTKPTLDCLCIHNSPTGYTVGEGALQCIVSEDNIGFCQGASGSQDVARNAYNMCVGKVDAIPNTHATLTATLIIQSSSPTVLQVTPSVSSGIETTAAASRTTTSPLIAATRTSIYPYTTTLTKIPTISATPAASQESPSVSSASPTSLTAAQISGIVIAVVGALALVAGLLFLLACLRKRKTKVRQTNLLPFQYDTGISLPNGLQSPMEKDPNYYRPRRNPNSTSPRRFQPVVPANAPEMPWNTVRAGTTTGPVAAEEIGVAISPDTSRRRSKLLPPPPRADNPSWVPQVLEPRGKLGPPLTISHPVTIPNPRRNPRQQGFASEQYINENETTSPRPKASNNGNNSYQSPANFNIPRKPPSSGPNISLPRLLVPEATVQPLNIQKRASHQEPRVPSSVYSQKTTTQPAEPDYGRTEHTQWRPRPQQPRRETEDEIYRRTQRHSTASSATSFDTQDSSPEARGSELRAPDLSPVVESPVGRSPVSYPKIPGLSPTYQFTTPPPWNSVQHANSQDPRAERRRSAQNNTQISRRAEPVTPTNQFKDVFLDPLQGQSPVSSRSSSSLLLERRRGAQTVGPLVMKADSRQGNWANLGRAGEGGKERGAADAGQARFMPRGNGEEGFPMSPRVLTPKRRGKDYILEVK